jgi:hypothetical protein
VAACTRIGDCVCRPTYNTRTTIAVTLIGAVDEIDFHCAVRSAREVAGKDGGETAVPATLTTL